MSASEQIAVLLAAAEGVFDDLEPDQVPMVEQLVRKAVTADHQDLCARIQAGENLSEQDRTALLNAARGVASQERPEHGNSPENQVPIEANPIS